MNTIQIVSGVLLFISCIFIILVVLIQESKDPGMTSAITGSSNDSFYGKNTSRTKEARLTKFTKFAAFLFFAATLAANLAAVYIK